jgi:tRNA threonylcarbamoyladenosine biosynthesis protein TsaE
MPPSNERVAEWFVVLPDERATRALGAALAQTAVPGMVVLLDGPLGAGKTTLVQGFAAAVGAERAASPSFVLAHSYGSGSMPLWHLDLYRIENAAEIADLDLDQYMPADGVALVEWAGRSTDPWPGDRIEVEMQIAGDGRKAHVRGRGRCAGAVELLAAHGAFA